MISFLHRAGKYSIMNHNFFIARKGYFTASSLVAMVTNSVAMVNHDLEHAYKIVLQNINILCGHISCIKFALNFA